MSETAVQHLPITFQSGEARSAKKNVYDLTPQQLSETMVEWGEPAYRANQVMHWLYKELATDFSQMTNLPAGLRQKLAETMQVGSAQLMAQKISSDGWTRKVLLQMRGGHTVEAVLMLYFDRATVCISSQVGCAMGCSFCATGQMGFTRNLSTGEILEQVIWFNRWLREHPHRPALSKAKRTHYTGKPANEDQKARERIALLDEGWHSADSASPTAGSEIRAVTNIVFMGMGEPLVNYNNVWGAIRTLNSPQGLGMGARRLTVSTVGIAPQIRRFADEEQAVNLAVSLHAPNDELRSSMVPVNTRYPIGELMAACRYYSETTRRRITFEYVLINGTNDSLDLAHQLAALLRGMLCHVNLIPLNPVPGTEMRATPKEQVYAFQRIVEDAGISTTVRIERGVDISAACGQLKVESEQGSKRRSLNPELVQAHVQADLALG
jgi:23S rRNA (adenine2503-C2)-methyltransferase